jgi:hypothetical protein
MFILFSIISWIIVVIMTKMLLDGIYCYKFERLFTFVRVFAIILTVICLFTIMYNTSY